MAGCVILASWAGSAAAAEAAHRSPQVNVVMTGSLTIAWTAGAGRGCAAANLCGVSGSLEMLAGGSASASGGPAPFELSDFNAAVRVITRAADGSVRSTCADLLPVDITLTVRHTTRGLRAVLGRQFFQPPSAGRCAGPTSADLGSIRLPVHRFGAHSYDFSGTTGSAAGPFEITTSSTVRALVTFGNSIPIPPGSLFGSGESFSQSSPTPARPLPTRSVLQESARVSYRVRAARGSIVTSFFGLPSPRCEPLGACGDSGRLTQSLSGLGGVTFSGSRIVARRVSAAGALADLRSGRMRLSGGFGMSLMREAVTESLTQADGSTCADGASGGQVALVPGERGHHDNLEVESASIGGGPDPLRTRCPGPSATEVLEPHLGLFASAPVSPSEIGAHHLSLTASAGGLFTGLGWSGSRGGTITLTLTRVRERGGTQRVHQLVGRPGVTFP